MPEDCSGASTNATPKVPCAYAGRIIMKFKIIEKAKRIVLLSFHVDRWTFDAHKAITEVEDETSRAYGQ